MNTTQPKNLPNTITQQRGAALLVSLILLLMLTIIGVSSIEDTTMQSNMARNSQFKMQVFNTALSESEAQYQNLAGDINLLTRIINTLGAYEPAAEMAGATPFDQDVAITFMGFQGAVVAKSKQQIMNLDMQNAAFEINSYAELPNTGSNSNQLQGLSYVAPSQQ